MRNVQDGGMMIFARRSTLAACLVAGGIAVADEPATPIVAAVDRLPIFDTHTRY